MIEQYISDEEYLTYFSKLNNLRHRIAGDLPIKPGMYILDLATGYGFFAMELIKRDRKLKIVGIDISQNDILNARKNVKEHTLEEYIEVIEMGSTNMNFPGEDFDMVVS